MKKKGLAIFLLLSGISYSHELGLDEILNKAKESNPNVIIKKMDTQIINKTKNKALKNYILPPIKISDSDYWENVKRYGVGAKSINVSMDIFEGGKSVYGYKILKSQAEIAKNEEVLSEITAQEQAVASYFSILNSKKQREITDKTIELLEKQKQRNLDLYNNGKLIPKSEYLKIEADIENNKVLNMENYYEEENSYGILARLLGYPLDTKFDLAEFNPEEYLKSKAGIEKVQPKKIENTILAQNQKHRLDIAKNNVNLAKADLYPTINIEYKHKFWDTDEHTKQRSKINEDRVSIGFKWIFEWGGTLDNISSKKLAYNQAQIRYEDEIKKISLEVKNQLNQIKSLYGQSIVMKKRMELLKETSEIDGMRYENDLISTFDYLNSVNKYRASQENYYKIQRDLVLAIIEYENLYK